jgi:hypothetical protein
VFYAGQRVVAVGGFTSTATATERRKLSGFIRTQRQMANLSLRQLCALAKVSNPYLSQVERGLHDPLALTPLRGHLVREDVHHGTHTSGVHS